VDRSIIDVVKLRPSADVALPLLLLDVVVEVLRRFFDRVEPDLPVRIVNQRGSHDRVHGEGPLLLLDDVEVASQPHR